VRPEDYAADRDRGGKGDHPGLPGGVPLLPMTDCPVRSGRIEINPVDDGYVVYDPDHDLVHYLNHTAAFVLELCTGQNAAAEIADTLKAAYEPGDSGGSIGELVGNCIEQLREQGLVRRTADPAPPVA
jgi:PqqD family protein of HPr-rel-A system